jgi:hypothetical protein
VNAFGVLACLRRNNAAGTAGLNWSDYAPGSIVALAARRGWSLIAVPENGRSCNPMSATMAANPVVKMVSASA